MKGMKTPCPSGYTQQSQRLYRNSPTRMASQGKTEHMPRGHGMSMQTLQGWGIRHTSLITITKTRRNHHPFALPFRGHAVHFTTSLTPQSGQVIPDPSDSHHHCSHLNQWNRNGTLREAYFHQELASELPFSCTYSDYGPKNILL